MLTASSLFLKSLVDFGITHAFVNWGSDHPALLEELERQRVQDGKTSVEIITCPNEMVALSAAQGYAQITRKPAAVLIHVDVGTQALAGAIHNVDRCRTPVLLYAGASPVTLDGELKGSRNEYIMWLQDVPDQSAIVRQYMRFTCQISSSKNIQQVVGRALLSATSEPKGPVYLWARREIMEEEVEENGILSKSNNDVWMSVEPCALSPRAAKSIAQALMTAQSPLIVTSYLGRNPAAVQKLVQLSEALAIPVFLSCPTVVNFPSSHPHLVGISGGMDHNTWLREADVILIIDSDIPFIPVHNRPRADALIFHIDVDVLKEQMGMAHVNASIRCKADAELALTQILEQLPKNFAEESRIITRLDSLTGHALTRVRELDVKEQGIANDGITSVANICCVLRGMIPQKSLILNESTTNIPAVWSHMRPDIPGSMFTSGSSSLGWGLGAAIGASLGNDVAGAGHEFIVLIVGDGSFLFGVPSSAYWIARRYNTPFLTIVLNNGGWKAPKMSMLGVYPNGLGSKASLRQLTTGFGPDAPDYSGIAVAAGGAWGAHVAQYANLEKTLADAVRVVKVEKRCAVVDCVIELNN